MMAILRTGFLLLLALFLWPFHIIRNVFKVFTDKDFREYVMKKKDRADYWIEACEYLMVECNLSFAESEGLLKNIIADDQTYVEANVSPWEYLGLAKEHVRESKIETKIQSARDKYSSVS